MGVSRERRLAKQSCTCRLLHIIALVDSLSHSMVSTSSVYRASTDMMAVGEKNGSKPTL